MSNQKTRKIVDAGLKPDFQKGRYRRGLKPRPFKASEFFSSLTSHDSLLFMSCAQDIHIQPNGPRHAGGQLAKESIPGV